MRPRNREETSRSSRDERLDEAEKEHLIVAMSKAKRARYCRDWDTLREKILTRDGWACVFCEAPHLAVVERTWGEGWQLIEQAESWKEGKTIVAEGKARGLRWQLIVLSVSHKNHDTTDNRAENLQSLCPSCHLEFDKKSHGLARRRTFAQLREARAEQTKPTPKKPPEPSSYDLIHDLFDDLF